MKRSTPFVLFAFLAVNSARLLQAGTPDEYIDVRDYGALADPANNVDDQPAIQLAVNAALAMDRPPPILLSGRHLIKSSIIINRPVDTTHTELRFVGVGPGAGIFVDSDITIFDSTLNTDPSAPLSERVTFDNVLFEADSVFRSAYVLSGKFLRIKFLNCQFRIIRCLDSSRYAQSYYFQNCHMKYWPGNGGSGGYFFRSAGCYDVSFTSCLIGSGGYFFRSTDSVRGANGLRLINNLIEGLSGATLTISGGNGVTILGNHIEGNPAADFNFWGGTLTNGSITVQGNFIYNPAGAAFYYGPTSSLTSIGNTYINSASHPLHANTAQVSDLNSLGDVFILAP